MTQSYAQAAELRDTILKIARKEIRRLAPSTRVGEVREIDRENNIAWVDFPGEDQPLRVSTTYGNQPRYAKNDLPDGTAPSDIVRVGGTNGNFYLMDVLSSSARNLGIEEDMATTLQNVVTEYAVNSSETVPPDAVTGGWSADTPNRLPGQFTWYRVVVTRKDGVISTTAPALLTGNAGSPGIPGTPGANGITYYTWLKYAPNATPSAAQMSDSPTGMIYMGIAVGKTSATESTVYTDYTWSLIQGPQGNQGIPGTPGADGTTTYTWVKYAPSATPTSGQLSDTPGTNTYIGFAFNKTTATESTVVSDYQFSLIQGPQGSPGIPGTPGADGVTYYTWLKYAPNATPTAGQMSDSPTGMTYMGIAVGQTSPTESTVYTNYNWSLIQGPQGAQGIPGTPGADGVTKYTWVKYADSPTTGMTDTATGKIYIGFAFDKTTATESTVYTDYTWSLIQGPQGNQGIPGTPGSDGVTYYTWLKYANSATPAAGAMSDSPTGMTYMGLAVGKTSATESTLYTDYTWSLIQGPQGNQGVPGTPGADGVTKYTWVKYATNATGTTGFADVPTGATYIGFAFDKTTATESTDPTQYQWSLIQGPQGVQGTQGIPGTPGSNGVTYYTWLKYADSPTTGMTDTPTGKTYMGIAVGQTSATESSVYGDYTWSLIQGPQGNQGIPGTPGANGITYYTWLKYAPNATPSAAQMSDSPTGMTYMGIAVGKTSATETTVYTDYTWSLIQGPQGNQGVPGTPGADGVTKYTWVKYATSATGTGLNDSPTGMTYIGFAFDKTTATESTVATDYQWSLIQGPQGQQGIPGTPGADGVTKYTWVKYATNATGTTGFSDLPSGATYIGFAFDKTTATESTDPTQYQWSLIQGPQGTQGNQGIPGTPGADGTIYYTWLKYADSPTTGMTDTPTGKAYMGIAVGKTTATESTVYTDYSWSLIQGPQGVQGNQGIPGTPGADGVTKYTWVKYADTPTTGMVDTPTGKAYIGLAFDKTTATESTVYSDYTWSQVLGPQGPAGNQGIPGTPGSNGITYYTWLKYAPNATPTGAQMSDTPGSNTYMGISVGQTSATESTNYLDYTWSLIQGPQGVQGNQGIPGTPGTNGVTTYTWVKYGTDVNGAGLNDSPTGMTYIGLAFNKTTATESTLASDYSWSLIQGAAGTPGTPGTPGTSVTAVTPFWAHVATGGAAPATPGNVATPSAPWVTPEPAYDTTKDLWTTNRITFSNSSYQYTTPAKESQYQLASTALTSANGKNKSVYSTGVPGSTANTAGDIWFQRDGTSGRIISQWEGAGGTSWVERKVDGLAIANIDAGSIVTGTLTGITITGATIQTASGTGERIVIRNDGSGGIIETYSGTTGESPGYIDPFVYAGAGVPAMTIAPGSNSTYTQRPFIKMRANVTLGNIDITNSSVNIQNGSLFIGGGTGTYGLNVYNGITVSSGGISFAAVNNGPLNLGGNNITGVNNINGTDTDINFNVTNGGLLLKGHANFRARMGQGASGASVVWQSGYIAIADYAFTAAPPITTSTSLKEIYYLKANQGSGPTTLSDGRVKDKIEPVEPVLEKMKKLKPKKYVRTDRADDDRMKGRMEYGVVAQELQESFPEAVVEFSEGGPLGVNYDTIYMQGMAAIQELIAEVEALKQEVSTLKGTKK